MELDKLDNCYVAGDAAKLLSTLEKGASSILIPKHFKNEFLKN